MVCGFGFANDGPPEVSGLRPSKEGGRNLAWLQLWSLMGPSQELCSAIDSSVPTTGGAVICFPKMLGWGPPVWRRAATLGI